MSSRHRTTPDPLNVPAFKLYGETGVAGAEMLHVEEIASRSRLYRWEIDAHVHRGLHQIVWLRSGTADASLDEARQRCTGPVAIIIPPGTVHAFRFAPDSQGHVLTLSPRLLVEGDSPAVGDALRALFARPQLLGLGAADAAVDRVESLVSELAAECLSPGPAGAPVPVWLARALVWRLAQICQRQSEGRDRGGRAHQALFTRFVVMVEAHFLEHWPMSRYAAQLGLTQDRLNRLVRAEAGRSALALVHERLAREACRRVIYVAAPISRLAFELGFEDPAYFCRFFRRHTGRSPREYRAAHVVDARGLGMATPDGVAGIS